MTAVTPGLSSARPPCPSICNTLSGERVSCSLSSAQTFRAHWQHGSSVFFPRSPGVLGYLNWGSPYYSGCLTHAALLGCPRQAIQSASPPGGKKRRRPVLPESVRDPHHAPSQAVRRQMGVCAWWGCVCVPFPVHKLAPSLSSQTNYLDPRRLGRRKLPC